MSDTSSTLGADARASTPSVNAPVAGRLSSAPGDRRGTHRVVSVAPMMERTDRHLRTMLRLISRHVALYTEMVTMGAVIHGDRDKLIGFSEHEHPLIIQLGGDDPKQLAEAAKIAVERGYDEVNLNVGCPSPRVSSGNFGASLMGRPEVVRDCVAAMRDAVDVPVTVKHRIGIDDIDTYEHMLRFVDIVSEAGSDRFTVHARKAWLQGLSPKQNRTVPPLRYDEVYRLKRERPELCIEINGGIRTTAETTAHLEHVDAVMIGRAAYETPYVFADMDHLYFGAHHAAQTGSAEAPVPPSREEVIAAYLPYVEARMQDGAKFMTVARHALTLFAGMPGTKRFKRHLTENGVGKGAGPHVLEQALALVPPAVRASRGAAGDAAVREEFENGRRRRPLEETAAG